MDDKTKSIVAHITLIGWIIALVMACGAHQVASPVVVQQNMAPGYPQQGNPQQGYPVPAQADAPRDQQSETPPTTA